VRVNANAKAKTSIRKMFGKKTFANGSRSLNRRQKKELGF
jgi:hypothetical protein